MTGGKSLKRSWSAEEIERALKADEGRPKGRKLVRAVAGEAKP